jgi:hypothetical protein
LLGLCGGELWGLKVDSFVQFAVQEHGIDDVEDVFPDLEVHHHCDLFDFHPQRLYVAVERYR